MSGLDHVTWQALGLVLTLLGLALSALVWARKGPARGLRAVAWSLLPLAAGLTGTLRLVGEIADAVTRWAARLAFTPSVWLGVVVALVAAALFMISGWLLRRGGATPGPAGSAPPVERATRPQVAAARDDEFGEIEAILRKHGIS